MKNLTRSTILTLSFAILVLLAASTPAAAQRQRYVTLRNDSDIIFREVHVSSAADPYWERDLLGTDYLRPGYEITVTMPEGQWDFKFVDKNYDACVLRNVIIDRNATVAVTTEWLEDNCTFERSSR